MELKPPVIKSFERIREAAINNILIMSASDLRIKEVVYSSDPKAHLRKLKAAGWTMQRLGEEMGYNPESARKSVSQFLKSHDPHISMLRRFAKAARISVATLVRE